MSLTCKECVMGSPVYFPCNKPAVAIAYWDHGEECPMCDGCLDHNTRNRGAKQRPITDEDERRVWGPV